MKLSVFHSIKDIDKADWDSIQPKNFPFCSYEFLSALEESQSTGERTGWFPLIFVAHDKEETLGALYLYLKTNSYGEYIFDWAWADAWEKAGLPYFPKLTSAIPFTPATGPKVLVKDEKRKPEISSFLLDECLNFYEKKKLQTAHFLFIPKEEISLFQAKGFTLRKTHQYHWSNENYETFEDFLAALKQKKRKEIRRERKLLDKSVIIHEVTGDEVSQYADLMYSFYLSTIDKKWAHDYLTKEFFELIFENFKDNILLYLAEKDGKFIAGTLNFYKGEKLFGRYWGSTQDIQHLHFELCYYRPIEFAIKNKIKLFEAGAQGEHKVQRGFIPAFTYSAHMLPNHGLGDAVKDFIQRESMQVSRLIERGRSLAFKD